MTVRTARHQAKWAPVRRPDGAPDQGIRARLRRAGVLAGALVLATALAGCGKVGQLEPAGPMFGIKAKSGGPAEVQKKDPTRPIETLDPRDRDAGPPAPPIPTPAPPTTQQ